jgi:hypothetical protein
MRREFLSFGRRYQRGCRSCDGGTKIAGRSRFRGTRLGDDGETRLELRREPQVEAAEERDPPCVGEVLDRGLSQTQERQHLDERQHRRQNQGERVERRAEPGHLADEGKRDQVAVSPVPPLTARVLVACPAGRTPPPALLRRSRPSNKARKRRHHSETGHVRRRSRGVAASSRGAGSGRCSRSDSAGGSPGARPRPPRTGRPR